MLVALDNVLIDRDDSMSLIDWSGGALGDPRYDLSLALSTEPGILLDGSWIASFFDGDGSTRTDPITMRWFRNLYSSSDWLPARGRRLGTSMTWHTTIAFGKIGIRASVGVTFELK